MKKRLLLFVFGSVLCCIAFRLSAQVAVSTDGTAPDNSAMFDVKSISKGVLLPRMTQAARNAIASPASSLMIYQTDVAPGYYYNAGTPATPSWLLVGGDLTLPFSKGISSDSVAFKITNTSSVAYSSAVLGISSSSTGMYTYGVRGDTYAPDGRGVFGAAISFTGYNVGVKGVTNSSEGIGVDGLAASNTGANIGVKGTTQSSSGIGVQGSATWPTGGCIGVYGTCSSSAGYSGYFTGGMFHVEGKVGIGNTNPDFPLVVMASVDASTDIADFRDPDNNNLLRIRQNGNGSGGVYIYDGAAVNTNTIFLYGNGNSFINGGNLGIGTTSPGSKLTVMGFAAKSLGGSTWTVISDARLNNLAGQYDKGLDEIASLQPVKFFYKAGNSFDLPSDQEQVGFVAQEVQKVFPEAVHETKDGYLDFNMHPVNVALVNAVKELKAENDRLKTEIEKIKEEMNVRLGKMEAAMNSRVAK